MRKLTPPFNTLKLSAGSNDATPVHINSSACSFYPEMWGTDKTQLIKEQVPAPLLKVLGYAE